MSKLLVAALLAFALAGCNGEEQKKSSDGPSATPPAQQHKLDTDRANPPTPPQSQPPRQ